MGKSKKSKQINETNNINDISQLNNVSEIQSVQNEEVDMSVNDSLSLKELLETSSKNKLDLQNEGELNQSSRKSKKKKAEKDALNDSQTINLDESSIVEIDSSMADVKLIDQQICKFTLYGLEQDRIFIKSFKRITEFKFYFSCQFCKHKQSFSHLSNKTNGCTKCKYSLALTQSPNIKLVDTKRIVEGKKGEERKLNVLFEIFGHLNGVIDFEYIKYEIECDRCNATTESILFLKKDHHLEVGPDFNQLYSTQSLCNRCCNVMVFSFNHFRNTYEWNQKI